MSRLAHGKTANPDGIGEISPVPLLASLTCGRSDRMSGLAALFVRAAFPLPILIVFPRLITLVMMIAFLVFFHVLERKGLSAPASYRNLRSWIVGKYRPGLVSVYKKRFIDLG